ncbi:MAG: site-specific integrase, partial [Corynebacterium sp.]|nr:site-specific integrase [Corynebacterium sp.]
GETSIDRVTPTRKNGKLVLRFSVCYHDGQRKQHTIQAPLGTSVTEIRRSAHKKAKRLLEDSGKTTWTGSAQISPYIRDVCIPAIERSTRLQPRSIQKYNLAARTLARALAGYSIRDAAHYDVLEKILVGIAKQHGRGSAISCQTVLKRYVLPRLVSSGYIASHPLAEMPQIDLSHKPGFTPRKGQRHTLTEEEWQSVLDHLLTRDTSVPLYPTAVNVKKSTITKHQQLVLLTVVQMATGLRISEAISLQWKDIVQTDGDYFIDLPASKSKGKRKSRIIPIIYPDVRNFLERHRSDPPHYVVGRPTDTTKKWDANNADDDLPELFRQVSHATGVKTLKNMRSHDWRATLNGIWLPKVGVALTSAVFGHSEEMNQAYYMDKENVLTQMELAKTQAKSLHESLHNQSTQ